MTMVVGLTGGIASGKSFVADYLKKKKISIHESDKIIDILYKKPTTNFVNFLIKEGFEKSLTKNKINKQFIREEIFNNIGSRKKLEQYLHTEVRKSRKKFLNKNKNKKIVFLDIPLLFENKLEKICNFICLTTSSLKIRKKRALKRPGMNKKLLDQIIKAQMKDKERKKKSHYLINTSGTKAKTCLQVDNIIYDILNNKK